MDNEAKQFAEEYQELERVRKIRNGWTALGIGGAAVGGIVALAGEPTIGGFIALGSALGAEPMALDAHDAVRSSRRSLNGLIEQAAREANYDQARLQATE